MVGEQASSWREDTMFVKPNPLMQCPNCGESGTQGYTAYRYRGGLYSLYFCSACICKAVTS